MTKKHPYSGRQLLSRPALLEPRRCSERALLAVIQQGYAEGVSTKRADDLVKALGCDGISKSQVPRICQELDEVAGRFPGRSLGGVANPYVWLDVLTQKVREEGRIVSLSVVVATVVNTGGQREIWAWMRGPARIAPSGWPS